MHRSIDWLETSNGGDNNDDDYEYDIINWKVFVRTADSSGEIFA